MNFETILYKLDGSILTITLNRPHVLNAMNDRMKEELKKAIEMAISNDEVRCIVLTGSGRSFSTGNDMKDSMGNPLRGLENQRIKYNKEMAFGCLFWDCPKPIIAAINGHCLGEACEVALACDISIAAESATFGIPEIRHGSGAIILTEPWNMGLRRAKELIFTGDTISAREAEKYEMVNRVVPDAKLLEETYRLSRKISKISSYSIRIAKQAINRTFEIMGFKMGLLQNVELMAILHDVDPPERVWFRQLVNEKGLKEALKIRANQFED